MSRNRLHGFLLVLPLAVACLCASAAVAGIYDESFTTTTYKDDMQTIAWWNTDDGELRVHDYWPAQVGSAPTGTSAQGVAIAGDYVFVAETGGLRSIQILNPLLPSVQGWCAYAGQAHDVCVDGDLAIVAAEGALWVADISTPASPTFALEVSPAGQTWYQSVVHGNFVFAARGTGGMCVFAYTRNPLSLSFRYSVGTGEVYGIAISGDYAFLAAGSAGLAVVSIRDPTTPQLLTNVEIPGGEARAITVSGNSAFVADNVGNRVVAFNIGNPTNPQLAGTAGFGAATGLDLVGDYLYVASLSPLGGLDVCDVSNPDVPHAVGNRLPVASFDVEVASGYAFLAAGDWGLQVARVCEDFGPVAYGTQSVTNAHDVVVQGHIAYTADVGRALRVIDVSDPTAPTTLGVLDTPGQSWSVAVADDYAFIGAASELWVALVGNPTAPQRLRVVSGFPSGDVSALAIHGDRLYATSESTSWLGTFDISTPSSPQLIHSLSIPPHGSDIEIAGRYAYIATYYHGLVIVDIGGAYPTLVSYLNGYAPALSVEASGNTLYLARSNTVLALDITNPTSPVSVGSVVSPTGARVRDIVVDGDRAFAVDESGSLWSVDISDPGSPVAGDPIPIGGEQYAAALAGDFVFAAGQSVFRSAHVYNRTFDTTLNIGVSLPVNDVPFDVLKARLDTNQSGTVNWSLSADDGTNWQSVSPDWSWHAFAHPGSQLRWMSTHIYETYKLNPTCYDLTLECLYAETLVGALEDVPGDQGGWLRLHFTRSAHDFAGDATPVTGYQILREVPAAAAAAVLERGVAPAAARAAPEALSLASRSAALDAATRVVDGHAYIVSSLLPEGTLPAGTWEVVSWVAAMQQHEYVALVPTLGDSTEGGITWSNYLITTHTTDPATWFVGLPDSGYSIDNLAPEAPTGLAFAYGPVLEWNEAPEHDFNYFTVYGGPSGDFDEASVIGYATDPELDISSEIRPWYFVTTKDVAGNASAPASIVAPLDVPNAAAAFTGLRSVSPNPFGRATEVLFALARAGHVRLGVYDLGGRLVRTLCDTALPAGEHHVSWRRDGGRAGIYFIRMEAAGIVSQRRAVALD